MQTLKPASFVLVLHTHMPYLKCAGRWPVGEDWLFQAWGDSYLPVLDVLDRQASRGRHDLVTVGLTPVLLHQMADPGLLDRFHRWIGHAMLRCEVLAANAPQWSDTDKRRDVASFLWRHYQTVLDSFEARDRQLVPSFRALAHSGTIEVLGGPLTHPYLPLHNDQTVRAQLELGLDETERQIGIRPTGAWLPECAYRPGLENVIEASGIDHVMLDGPSILQASEDSSALHRGWTLGSSTVATLARDLEVAYRVWSPTGGYPGAGAYREFHKWEWETGHKLWRVTSRSTQMDDKAFYDPTLADAQIDSDVTDFHRLLRNSVMCDDDVVVACYDTELFGHWWSEGPAWLDELFDALVVDDVIRPCTMASYLRSKSTSGRLSPPAGSWGLRKDFSIWDNDETRSMWNELEELDRRLDKAIGAYAATQRPGEIADRLLVQGARELMLAQCSDWPFKIGHGKYIDYAHERFDTHAAAAHHCFDALETTLAGSHNRIEWLTDLEADHDVATEMTAGDVVAAWRP